MKYLIIILTLLPSALFSQTGNEISVWGSGGLSTLFCRTVAVEREGGFGGAVGVGYTRSLSPKINLLMGAELALYHTYFSVGRLSDNYTARDRENNPFEFRSEITGYHEKHRTLLVNIPLMLQYRFGNVSIRGPKQNFFVSAGVKIGLPLVAKYSIEEGTVNNSGYYAFEDISYDTQRFMGFGSFPIEGTTGHGGLKIVCSLSAEAGIRLRSLYISAFIDYGLNDINRDGHSEQLVAYNRENPQTLNVNSALCSQYSENGQTEELCGKAFPVAAGIKLRYAFGLK